MTLDSNIYDIPNMLDISDISNIPVIPNIIQLGSTFWFLKGMTVDVCLSWLSYDAQYSWNS